AFFLPGFGHFVASAAAGIATRPGRPLPGQDSHLLEQRTFARRTWTRTPVRTRCRLPIDPTTHTPPELWTLPCSAASITSRKLTLTLQVRRRVGPSALPNSAWVRRSIPRQSHRSAQHLGWAHASPRLSGQPLHLAFFRPVVCEPVMLSCALRRMVSERAWSV